MAQKLDKLDVKLLKMLSENARKPYLEIARETGVSGAAIHQRMAKLQSLGIVKGTETLIDPASIGYETTAYLGVFLRDPSRFDEILAKLQQIPEIVECHLITGQYDLLLKVFARNNEDLLNFIHTKIFTLNLGRTETNISLKELFRRQLPVDIQNN